MKWTKILEYASNGKTPKLTYINRGLKDYARDLLINGTEVVPLGEKRIGIFFKCGVQALDLDKAFYILEDCEWGPYHHEPQKKPEASHSEEEGFFIMTIPRKARD